MTKPNGDIILFDPLYHTPVKGGGGTFDIGQGPLKNFMEQHNCRIWCIRLRLTNLSLSPPSFGRPKPRPAMRIPTPALASPSSTTSSSNISGGELENNTGDNA
jgi:hypothetical protein